MQPTVLGDQRGVRTDLRGVAVHRLQPAVLCCQALLGTLCSGHAVLRAGLAAYAKKDGWGGQSVYQAGYGFGHDQESVGCGGRCARGHCQLAGGIGEASH